MVRTDLGNLAGTEGFADLLDRIDRGTITRWQAIEADFIDAVTSFDRAFAEGHLSAGQYRKKAAVFNDLVVGLVQNASHQQLAKSTKRSSNLFDEIDIDLCFPASRDEPPLVGAEVKVLGAPGHAGNRHTPRPSSQDAHKRVREVALTAIDFKAANSEPHPISSFNAWCMETRPKYYSFWAFRVAHDADFARVRQMMNGLRTYCNGVGAIIYEAASRSGFPYRKLAAPELSLDKALRDMAQEVIHASQSSPTSGRPD